MKVLVTGSAGFIGKALVPKLTERGHELVGVDLRDGTDILQDTDLVAGLMQECDAVVHLAAIAYPRPVEWGEFWRCNCVMVEQVASLAEQAGVRRLVFTSSTAYYGAELPWEPVDFPVREWSPSIMRCRPRAIAGSVEGTLYYPVSKVIAETILAAYGLRQALEVVIFRMCPCSVKGKAYPRWDLRLTLERAVDALVWAVEYPGTTWYQVFNLAEPDVEAVCTLKLRLAQARR